MLPFSASPDVLATLLFFVLPLVLFLVLLHQPVFLLPPDVAAGPTRVFYLHWLFFDLPRVDVLFQVVLCIQNCNCSCLIKHWTSSSFTLNVFPFPLYLVVLSLIFFVSLALLPKYKFLLVRKQALYLAYFY